MAYAAIVLAAGHARRFGRDKLQAVLDGRPLLDHAIEIAAAAPVDRVVVVTRPGCAPAATSRIKPIELASDALSDSLKAGLNEVGDADGAFIFLGDMPRVPKEVAGILAEALGSAVAAFPTYREQPGHPVLLASAGFGLVERLQEDEGLGRLLRGRNDVVRIAVPGQGVVSDVDVPSDVAALQQKATD